MNALDPTEKNTLKELQRLFADPLAAARRYRRYAVLCFVGAFACPIAEAVVSHFSQWKDAEMVFALVAGIAAGLGLYFLMGAKQAPYLTRYCTLDAEAVRQRLAEGAK